MSISPKLLESLETPQRLAYRLGTSYSNLTHTIYGIGVKNLYTTFTISKKSGGTRTIRAPKLRLNRIQDRLKSILCELYKPHRAASAFIEGRGIVYNASQHVRKSAVFNVDLKEFYDSINFGRIFGMLKAKPYCLDENVARIISHICCVDGLLPQGAPTSPVISNMIARSLDHELSSLAREEKAYYTRYADDITFSFSKKPDMSNNIYVLNDKFRVNVSTALESIINRNGFKLNKKKTRINFSDERQVVTGLKVNRKVNVDRRYIRTTRAMTHSLSVSVEGANERFKESVGDDGASRLEYCVAGRINFIGMVKGVESTVYQNLATKFNSLELDIEVPLAPPDLRQSLEESLHFYSYRQRTRLEHSVWVVEFDGIEGLTLDQQLVQGTAFAIKGERLYSCLHIFDKASSKLCQIYRISSPQNKYMARIVRECRISDSVELEFVNEPPNNFRHLNVYDETNIHGGYQLSIVGFPEKQAGHATVSIVPCVVTNSFFKSKVRYLEVDKQIYGGASGSPVLNKYMQVVGMATTGASIGGEGEEKVIEGSNAFVSAGHFFKSLKP